MDKHRLSLYRGRLFAPTLRAVTMRSGGLRWPVLSRAFYRAVVCPSPLDLSPCPPHKDCFRREGHPNPPATELWSLRCAGQPSPLGLLDRAGVGEQISVSYCSSSSLFYTCCRPLFRPPLHLSTFSVCSHTGMPESTSTCVCACVRVLEI